MSKPIKNKLQEYFQKRGQGLPDYETCPGESKGGKPPLWMCKLTLPTGEQFKSGYCVRKADAENEVATKAYDSLIHFDEGGEVIRDENVDDVRVEVENPVKVEHTVRKVESNNSGSDFRGLLADLQRSLNVTGSQTQTLPQSGSGLGFDFPGLSTGANSFPGVGFDFPGLSTSANSSSGIGGGAYPCPNIFDLYPSLFAGSNQSNSAQPQPTQPIQNQTTFPNSNSQTSIPKRIVILVDLENKHKIIDAFFSELNLRPRRLNNVSVKICLFVSNLHDLVDKQVKVPDLYSKEISVQKIVVPFKRQNGVDACMCSKAGQMLERREYDKYIVVTSDSFGLALVDLIRLENEMWESRESVVVIGVKELVREVFG